MKNLLRAFLILLIAALLFGVPVTRSLVFTVDEREQAVVVRFGEPVASYTEPGLKFKLPLIDDVCSFPKTYQFCSGAEGEILVDLPTADGRKIEVTPWAVWRIPDPVRFVETFRTAKSAETRILTFVRAEMRNVITCNKLTEVIRSTNREMKYQLLARIAGPQESAARQFGADEKIKLGRETIVHEIRKRIHKRLGDSNQEKLGGRGIELVDVGIGRVDFGPAVREAVFARQIAFLDSVASRYTNEAERRKQEILNRTEAEVQTILGQGRQKANMIRGDAEAKITGRYAQTIRESSEFCDFLRALDAYRETLGQESVLIPPLRGDLLKLLKGTQKPSTPSRDDAPSQPAPPSDADAP